MAVSPDLARRLRRPRRGMALLEALLALAVMGVAVAGASVWIEIERTHERAREAGRTVAVLADAARQHVHGEYADFLARKRRVPLGGLQVSTALTPSILPEQFQEADAMKRSLGVWVVPDPAASGVLILAGQAPEAGDTRRPHAALARARPGQRLGIVETDRCPGSMSVCLLGPGVAADLSAFRTTFESGAAGPALGQPGALMELYGYAHGDFCGEFLHRLEDPDPDGTGPLQPLCPNGNRMAQDLVVTGGIVNAARIVGGTDADLVVHGGLTVGGRLKVAGDAAATGRLDADAGAVVDGNTEVTGTGITNPVCDPPPPPAPAGFARSAVCAEDRAIARRLHVVGEIDVRGRTGSTPRNDDAEAGAAGADCIAADVLVVEERIRVAGRYSESPGAGVGSPC